MIRQLFFLLFFTATVITAGAQDYHVVDKGSIVRIDIKNVGMNIDAKIGGLNGTICFNPADLKNASFNVTADPFTLNTGIDVRDSTVIKEKEFLWGSPISFVSKQVSAAGNGNYIVKGTLSIRNSSKDISIPFTVAAKDGGMVFTGQMHFYRTDFGMAPGNTDLSNAIVVNLLVFAKK